MTPPRDYSDIPEDFDDPREMDRLGRSIMRAVLGGSAFGAVVLIACAVWLWVR